jgi:hypothetical protein
MSLRKHFHFFAATATVSLMMLSFDLGSQRALAAPLNIGKKDIGGVVTSSKGPEAGVWVIAETKDLPTKFARIVVTDDQGRYLIPDLPQANYQVFVRGYGLLDSKWQPAAVGRQVDLKAEIAPDAKSAAQVYPAAWWVSMLNLPADKEAQRKLLLDVQSCYNCHALGNKITRELGSGSSKGATSTLDAWDRRTAVGPSGPGMSGAFHAMGPERALFADWTDRIAKGEAPAVAPTRPAGVERNLVITEWDWGTPKDGRSDTAASDTRDPRVNANGLVFAASEHTDGLNILDPVRNKSFVAKVPSEAPPLASSLNNNSPYAGPDAWKRSADPRSVAIDGKGRVWLAVRNREATKQPAFCGPGSNKFGNFYPIKQSGRQLAVYDSKTKEWQYIDTCFSADHNQISKDNFIYFGFGAAVGWVDINTWDKTHDAEASQGWCPGVIDTNGDGKISTGWTEPNDPIDPTKDHRINFDSYSTTINPKDGTLWISGVSRGDKRLVRISKGSNPPETCHTEFFEPPPNQRVEVFGSGGVEADENGVVWQNWRVSGHFTAFDRSKCKTTNDPKVTGQSCPEGWSIYRYDNVPAYGNSVFNPAASYLSHMDIFDTLGFGKDAPMYGTTNLDALVLYDQKNRQFVTLRIPYPMGFMPRSASGRIDDPKAGWKGRGLWTNYGSYVGWHSEGGYGTLPKSVKLQMRPDPLAD